MTTIDDTYFQDDRLDWQPASAAVDLDLSTRLFDDQLDLDLIQAHRQPVDAIARGDKMHVATKRAAASILDGFVLIDTAGNAGSRDSADSATTPGESAVSPPADRTAPQTWSEQERETRRRQEEDLRQMTDTLDPGMFSAVLDLQHRPVNLLDLDSVFQRANDLSRRTSESINHYTKVITALTNTDLKGSTLHLELLQRRHYLNKLAGRTAEATKDEDAIYEMHKLGTPHKVQDQATLTGIIETAYNPKK